MPHLRRLLSRLDDRSVKVFTHEFIWISFGHVVTIVAGLLSIRLYTELAPREVLGGASLVMGAMTLLMNLIVAPFTQTQVRYQAEYSRLGQGDSYQVFILQHALVATLMAGVPMTACLLVWPATRLGSSVIVIPMLAVWALSTTLQMSWSGD